MKNDQFRETISELFKGGLFHNTPSYLDTLKNKKIILYGAGGGLVSFSVFILKRYGLKAHVVLDLKCQPGCAYLGIPASSPREYRPTDDEKENAVVIITVVTKKYHEEIFNCLRSLGFKNIVLSTDIYEYHLPHPCRELEERGFKYYLDTQSQIERCLELFEDSLSRAVFASFIKTHMLRRTLPIPFCSSEDQYFPKDIDLKKGYARFVNCGAYTGDTVIQLNALFGKVESVACFEPDIENFRLLMKYLCGNHSRIAQNVIAFPCGVYSNEKQLLFSDGDETNSMISAEGESIIQCVALDHVIPGFEPTFIQMDVEGAELEALKGAEMLIKENKPDLAICVYHAPNHIWDIPLYLESLNLGYKYYLRNYSSFTSETVLYATEEERIT